MYQRMFLITAIVFYVAGMAGGQIDDESGGSPEGGSEVRMTALSEPRVSGTSLTWRFQIRNDSAHDVWICEAMSRIPCEVHLASDDETLLVTRRLDLPTVSLGVADPWGRYARLRSGQTRTELLSLPLPILPRYVLSTPRQERPLEHGVRLTLEIGYYSGDFPMMIVDTLRQNKSAPQSEASYDIPFAERGVGYWFVEGVRTFLLVNGTPSWENKLSNRSESLTIPYTYQSLKGERTLRLEAEYLRIPYLEEEQYAPYRPDRPARPDLRHCTRIDITFKSTASDFFFPYPDEQSLLSRDERERLQSLGRLVMDDRETLDAFANTVAEGMRDAFVTDRGVAELMCYRDDEKLVSLMAYDSSYLVDGSGQVFKYMSRLPSIRGLSPQVRALDLRVQCANQLEDLWYHLRVYHKDKMYPAAKKWSDAILVSPRRGTGRQDVFVPVFRCPVQNQGRCHYARNPNCLYGSPPDMVLLFETQAGWNQHGGPELFTFENHEPRGGLVLLNDGTVRFIRTEEELKQLRWE